MMSRKYHMNYELDRFHTTKLSSKYLYITYWFYRVGYLLQYSSIWISNISVCHLPPCPRTQLISIWGGLRQNQGGGRTSKSCNSIYIIITSIVSSTKKIVIAIQFANTFKAWSQSQQHVWLVKARAKHFSLSNSIFVNFPAGLTSNM